MKPRVSTVELAKLIEIVKTILDFDAPLRNEALAEFRSIYSPLVKAIASNFLQYLPDYELDDLVDDAFSCLVMGMWQTTQGEPTVRLSPLQKWLSKPTRGNLNGWIATCVANFCRDLRRQRLSKRMTQSVSLETPEFANLTSPNSLHINDKLDLICALREAAAKLPPHDFEIIKKIEIEGMSCREVAKFLGITESQARRRHALAIQRLTRLYKHGQNR